MDRKTSTKTINNAFYEELHDDWYDAKDHPVALLRAENQVRNPWIAEEISSKLQKHAKVLDVGCGAGLLTNFLSTKGHQVSGIDISQKSLDIAKKKDKTRSVEYVCASAYALPFENESFDVVTAMDVLEHVEDPQKLIAESSRVLKKGGLFFFHTFNRNLLSYLLIIKGVDFFVKNAPKNMHVYPLFIKPQELQSFCQKEGMQVISTRGLRPKFNWGLFSLIFGGDISDKVGFCFSKSLATGYCGVAVKSKQKDFV